VKKPNAFVKVIAVVSSIGLVAGCVSSRSAESRNAKVPKEIVTQSGSKSAPTPVMSGSKSQPQVLDYERLQGAIGP